MDRVDELDVEPGLAEVLKRMLAFDPDDRFPSAAALLSELVPADFVLAAILGNVVPWRRKEANRQAELKAADEKAYEVNQGSQS